MVEPLTAIVVGAGFSGLCAGRELRRAGIDAQTVLATVAAVGGIHVGEFLDRGIRVPIVVRLDGATRSNPELLAQVPVKTANGTLPTGQLVTFETTPGPSQIGRERLSRRITVQLDVRGRDVGSFVEEAKKKLGKDVKLPTGYYTVWAGEYERLQSAARQLAEKGLKFLRATNEDLVGQYVGEDLVNMQTGEIFAEAGDEISEKTLKLFEDVGVVELPLLDIDHVNVGPYVRNTLAVDKNSSREEALFDIYRVMRPGEPPTVETAEKMFNDLSGGFEKFGAPGDPLHKKIEAYLQKIGITPEEIASFRAIMLE